MPEILITENIVGPAFDALGKSFDVAFEPALWKSPEKLVERLAGVKALVVRNQTKVTRELIARASDLLIIGRAGAGLDNVDVEAASAAGIVVNYTPVQNSISVAELALGLMLGLARRIPAADRHVKAGGWERHAFMGVELFGKTLGVLGLGRIGFLTAMRAKAFGMDVLAYDPLVDPDSPMVAEVRPQLVELDELLAGADYVTCHLPATPATRGLLGYERFSRMKRGAFFINVARGEVVEEAGLVRALLEKRIAGAALDVRGVEPPAASELEAMDNVILLPHLGAFTDEAQERVVACVARDVAAVLRGQAATSSVNFPRPKR